MQLSKNQKLLFNFSSFPKCAKHLEYFEKGDDPHKILVSEIIDSKMRGYLSG